MTEQTEPSKYVLGQEHITDREIDQLYEMAKNMQLRLERFKEADKKYRALEEEHTETSEAERIDLLVKSDEIMDNIRDILKDMVKISERLDELFIKAKGALQAKLEIEKNR
jgi:hypothetical protein